MPTQALPEIEDMREMLAGLLGRDVTITRETPEKIKDDQDFVVGLYERENAKVGGLVVADLEVAAFAGAALSLLPIAIAKESIADGRLADVVFENFQEVLNVAVRWFTAKGNPRVVLAEVYPPGTKLPDDVKAVMGNPNDRLDVTIDITGYGGGRLRLLAMDFSNSEPTTGLLIAAPSGGSYFDESTQTRMRPDGLFC